MRYFDRLSRSISGQRSMTRAYRWLCVLLSRVPLLGILGGHLASRAFPPYHGQHTLATMSRRGFVSRQASIHHDDLRLGRNVFIGKDVIIYRHGGGSVTVGDGVHINDGVYIETGPGGAVRLGAQVHVHHDCHIASYGAPITIGGGTLIAPRCALYSFDHGIAAHAPIRLQEKTSRGPITIGANAWLGYGAIVVSGVEVGEGAVVGAGSVVTRDVPANAVVMGNPARVVKHREMPSEEVDSE